MNDRLSPHRLHDITASVAGALFGVHPYTTTYRLWAQKTGRLSTFRDNRAQRRGSLFEPVAVKLIAHQRPEWQIEYPLDNKYWRDEEYRLGATPDAFVARPDLDGVGILQIKTVAEDAWRQHWLDPDTSDAVLPSWVAIQAITEAYVTGCSWATVAAVRTPRGLDDLVEGLRLSGCANIDDILSGVAFAWLALGKVEVETIDVPLHPGIVDRLKTATAAFWDVIAAGKEPPPDWSRDGDTVLDVFRDSEDAVATLGDPATFAELVARYDEVCQAKNKAEREADALKPQIIQMLGNADRAETERWKVSAKTQHKKAYSVRESQFRALRVKDKLADNRERLP